MKFGSLIRVHHLLIALVFLAMILGLVAVANIGMDVLTSMRAYVGGEGLWSKAQKDAVHYLLRYAGSHSEEDYERYRRAIAIPLADHDARVEMQKPDMDPNRASDALVAGGNHPADVRGMVNLFRRYHREPYIAHAIEVWGQADVLLGDLHLLGERLHEELSGPAPNPENVAAILKQIDALNERFPSLEDDFSRSLGDGARSARTIVFDLLAAGAVFALLLGLFASYRLIVRAHDADQQYRHLFETASDAVIIADHSTDIILDANAKLAELTGIPIEKLKGTEQRRLFGRQIPVMQGSSDLDMGDLVIRHVTGLSIPVDVGTSQGRFGGRLVDYSVVRDVRERRRMEDQLRDAARMESVGRLAGGVAHDFNNLLTVISGYAQSLKRISLGPPRDKADQILAAAQRAAGLVKQLLAFSRKQPLDPQPLNLNRLITNIAGLIRGVLNEQIELCLDLDPDLGTVEADRHQLEQILLNLAANSRDAMPQGGKLVVRTWNQSSPEQYVGVSVADNGHGMDESTRRRVFEPFFTTKPLGKGTGLGLATVYGTVKQSHGQISVLSAPGKGTTFRILLPRTYEMPRADSEVEIAMRPAGTERVLLVEDDAGVREVLAHGLEQEGYVVATANNGREAIELVQSCGGSFSVIITDVIMPEMGGIAMAEQLQRMGFTIPVLYATGYHQDLEKYTPAQLPLGAGLLLKPFTPPELGAAIRRALPSRSATNTVA